MDRDYCDICGADLEWIDCPVCGGVGGWDCWEEDPINYSPGEDWERCEACDGEGGWLECPCADSLNHRLPSPGV